VFVYETDLEKAKALLEEAGVEEGTEIRYWTTGEAPEIGQILQAQLAPIGIDVKIEQRETSSYIGTFYGDQPWPERPELMAWTWWPDYNDPTDWAWVLMHTAASGSSGANAGFYSNERADEIMDLAFSIADEEELCELYKEFQDIVIRQDPAWITLIEPPDEAVLRIDIGGYQANPLYRGTFDFYNMYREGY
jgi:ABC-type transport system substrate-binding protein